MIDFSKVVEVRSKKLGRLKRAEKNARHGCNISRRNLENCQTAMEDYIEEIKTLEIRLLSKLVETRITHSDINDMNVELQKAKRKADELAENLNNAKRALEEAESEAEARRADRFEGQMKLTKISEINDKFLKQEATDRIKAEDAEMDEIIETFTGRKIL